MEGERAWHWTLGDTVAFSQAFLVVSLGEGSRMMELEPKSGEETDVELIDCDDDGQETAPPCGMDGRTVRGGQDLGSVMMRMVDSDDTGVGRGERAAQQCREWALGGGVHRVMERGRFWWEEEKDSSEKHSVVGKEEALGDREAREVWELEREPVAWTRHCLSHVAGTAMRCL